MFQDARPERGRACRCQVRVSCDLTLRIRNSVTKCAFLVPVIARRFCNGPLISQHFQPACHAGAVANARTDFSPVVGVGLCQASAKFSYTLRWRDGESLEQQSSIWGQEFEYLQARHLQIAPSAFSGLWRATGPDRRHRKLWPADRRFGGIPRGLDGRAGVPLRGYVTLAGYAVGFGGAQP